MTDWNKTAEAIIENLGGVENITNLSHCITRLRFTLKDDSKANVQAIKNIDGVLGYNLQGTQHQVIIGPAVENAFQAVTKLVGDKVNVTKEMVDAEKADAEALENAKGKKWGVKPAIDALTAILSPIIPAYCAAGMLKVVLLMLTSFHLATGEEGAYVFLNMVGDVAFYFLPIMIGAFSAKKFGANPALGMVIGGILLYPSFAAGVGAGVSYNFLGIPVYGVTYSSTIFPIILCCAVMAPIEKFVAKHSPEILRSVLEPLVTIIIMIPLALCLLGPVGSYLGQYLSAFVLWVYNTIGFVGVALFAAIMPFVVMTGMHGAFVPYLMQMLTVSPLYEPIFFPALIISNINQGISALAVAVKTKDKNLKSTGLSTGVTAVVAGVTEPAMYAVNLKLKTPMYGAMVGSAIGGLVAGILKTAIYAFAGASSVIALPLFISADKPNNFLFMVIAVIVGAVATFVATWFLYKDEQ